MNYPLPETLKITPIKPANYMAVPGYGKIKVYFDDDSTINNNRWFSEQEFMVNQRFSSISGFDDFTPNVSEPYEITVTNANQFACPVKLFDSFNTRPASNFDNRPGITITSSVASVTSGALLAQTESKNFECGMTYIQVVSGSNAALTSTWQLTTKDASGQANVVPKTPKKDPRQQQSDVLEFYNTFKIDGYTKIEIILPPNTSVTYSFYPSATVDPSRQLNLSRITPEVEMALIPIDIIPVISPRIHVVASDMQNRPIVDAEAGTIFIPNPTANDLERMRRFVQLHEGGLSIQPTEEKISIEPAYKHKKYFKDHLDVGTLWALMLIFIITVFLLIFGI